MTTQLLAVSVAALLLGGCASTEHRHGALHEKMHADMTPEMKAQMHEKMKEKHRGAMKASPAAAEGADHKH